MSEPGAVATGSIWQSDNADAMWLLVPVNYCANDPVATARGTDVTLDTMCSSDKISARYDLVTDYAKLTNESTFTETYINVLSPPSKSVRGFGRTE